MNNVALQLVETDEVAARSLTIVEQAKAVKVINSDTYTQAGFIWKSIKAMMAEVDEAFDKNIKRWHEGHKDALADKAKYYAPLDQASRSVKKLMSDYDAEQERIRKAEEVRLAEIARKAAEEQALLDAIAAEEEAKRNGATKEEAAQVSQAIIEEPVYVAPVVVPKSVPKMTGGPVYRTIWKFRIKNAAIIPREYLVPDEVRIGGVVRSMKSACNIPGIEAYEERV